MTKFTVIGMALVVAASSRVPIHAQDQRPSPTFRSTVQYIEVDARVVDARGNPVLGLRKEDFHLREDGVEQTIDAFTAVDLPVETHTATPVTANGTLIGPDVTTNTDQATLRGRLYVLMLDDRQIAAANTATVIRIAKRFIERDVGPQDLVAMVTTTGRADVSQSFTSNKPLLLGAIGRFMGHKLDPIELDPFPEADVNIRKTEQFQASRMALQGLASVCDWLGGITGITKSLVLISEGVDYDTETDFIKDAWATELLHEQRNAIAAATRANVTIYPVDPRGLGSDDSIVANNMTPLIHKRLQQGIERAHANLREIAVDTGGVEAVNTNQFEKALDRIVTHGSRYYLLGYHPANTRRDGKFRTIKVTVDRPGAQVLARRGYGEGDQAPKDVPVQLFAERDPLPRSVRETLNNPLPLHEMTLSITAAAYRGTGSNASLAIVVESPALTFNPVDGKSTGTVDIVTAAIDDQNTVVTGQSNQITFKVGGPNAEPGVQRRFRTMSRLNDLAPGRYELRVATTDREAGRRGSVWYAVEVPDFSKGRLTMSGLLVSSLGESRTLTANPDPAFANILPSPPTTAREFLADDELTVFAEIYDNDLSREHQVDLTTTLTNADGKTIYSRGDWAPFKELVAARGVYRTSTWIPLGTASPGDYTITISAQRRIEGEDQPVVRSVPIKVAK